MKSEYLSGVYLKPSSFPKIFILGNGNDTWYAGSYVYVKANQFVKQSIIDLTNKVFFRNDKTIDWEWHHIVETQHMSQIVTKEIDRIENFDMPTILISKEEHKFLSRNFNNCLVRLYWKTLM